MKIRKSLHKKITAIALGIILVNIAGADVVMNTILNPATQSADRANLSVPAGQTFTTSTLTDTQLSTIAIQAPRDMLNTVPFYIAVYKDTDQNASTWDPGTLVGVSTSDRSFPAVNAVQTWSFTNAVLSNNTVYVYMFTSNPSGTTGVGMRVGFERYVYGAGEVFSSGQLFSFGSGWDIATTITTIPREGIDISPSTDLNATGREGGPFTPSTMVYTLENASALNPVGWVVSNSEPWISVMPASGTISPGGTAAVTVSIDAVANTLPLGIHTGSVEFSNTVSGATQTRNVGLRIDRVASMPFSENFENGTLGPYWTISGTEEYKAQITANNSPHGGTYHLTMDDSVDGSAYSRNEITLNIDLANYENVVLDFWAKDFGDEDDGPPTIPFTDDADFDGVAISMDGVLWYEIQGLRSEINSTYTQLTVDLDAAIATHGLSYSSAFKIRFNQYDNFSIPTDGIAIDDITITGNIEDDLEVGPMEDLTSTGRVGGPFSPLSASYTLSNVSASNTISWGAENNEAWVTVAPDVGILSPGGMTSVVVSINTDAQTLPAGSYMDTITFSNQLSGLVRSRNVTLNILTAPEIQVSPMEGFVVTNQMGQTTNRTLVVSNAATADGNLDFTIRTRKAGQSVLNMAADGVGTPPPSYDFTKIAAGSEYTPARLLVRFDKGIQAINRNTTAATLGGKILRHYKLVPGLCLVELNTSASMNQALVSFNEAADVVYAQPDYIWKLDQMPNDTRFTDLWGMHNTGQTEGTPDADIDAPEAWDIATGNDEMVVAVIDTGVDYTHPDLDDNMWVNTGEIPGNGLDDDGNGYVDDVHGYDFVNDDGDPMDDHDHGTHCAGTVGGEGDNAEGVAGVCWDVQIMAIKFISAANSGSTADAISSVEYASLMGAKVMSNSWGGGGYDQALKDVIDAAGALGIPFVAAAGNDGTDNDSIPHYPSSYDSDNVIAVVNSDHNDDRWGSSSYGLISTDLAAPGTGILSCKRGGGYASFTGTSMATPHVAGACALMLSLNPDLTAVEMKQILMDTVDPTLPGICASGGRMNLANAIEEVGAPWLAFAPDSGSGIAPGEVMNVTLTFDATLLAAGTYTSEVVVVSNDPETPTVTLPARMQVEPDDLDISPNEAFESTGLAHGPFSPTNMVYSLTNNGMATLGWTVLESASWADVSPTNGTLTAGATATVTAFINETANSLPAGSYSEQILFSNLMSGVAQSRNMTLEISLPPLDVFYSFPMDSDPGWTTEGQWELGQPLGEGSGNGDPSSGHSGLNVYGYNLAGDYANSMPQYWLTTTALDCSARENVTLRFYRVLGVESASYDHADIEVSNDGSTWSTVWSHAGDSFSDSSWQEMSYDISAVADGEPTVYIRWGMGSTDISVTFPGWNIDDVVLEGSSFPGDDDADGIPDAWEITYFGHPSNCIATVDWDLDGHNNLQESITGMDPTNALSVFMITNYTPLANSFRIEWPSVSGRVYTVYWSTNLMDSFHLLETGMEYPRNSSTDTIHAVEDKCFYKVDVQLK